MQVENCVALVTGGNRGIGEAFVRALIAGGARKVYIGTRSIDAAAHLTDEFESGVVAVELDVTNAAHIGLAAEVCTDTNILVNNAGAFFKQTLIGADDMSAAREEMEVMYFGSLAMSRAFAPILATNGGGAIVNVLSAGAIVAMPNMGGYSPAKFAARAMSTNLRAELQEQGTQVNALIVGSVDTRMAAHVAGNKEPPAVIAEAGIKSIEKNIPEMDTDAMAIYVRAALARDPVGVERQMASLLKAETISTGR